MNFKTFTHFFHFDELSKRASEVVKKDVQKLPEELQKLGLSKKSASVAAKAIAGVGAAATAVLALGLLCVTAGLGWFTAAASISSLGALVTSFTPMAIVSFSLLIALNAVPVLTGIMASRLCSVTNGVVSGLIDLFNVKPKTVVATPAAHTDGTTLDVAVKAGFDKVAPAPAATITASQTQPQPKP